jgi:hypothetical protein
LREGTPADCSKHFTQVIRGEHDRANTIANLSKHQTDRALQIDRADQVDLSIDRATLILNRLQPRLLQVDQPDPGQLRVIVALNLLEQLPAAAIARSPPLAVSRPGDVAERQGFARQVQMHPLQ